MGGIDPTTHFQWKFHVNWLRSTSELDTERSPHVPTLTMRNRVERGETPVLELQSFQSRPLTLAAFWDLTL